MEENNNLKQEGIILSNKINILVIEIRMIISLSMKNHSQSDMNHRKSKNIRITATIGKKINTNSSRKPFISVKNVKTVSLSKTLLSI